MNQEIVQKLWNLCNVLRDDGITYHQYVTELTYILFLKMAQETGQDADIIEEYRWDNLARKDGLDLFKSYKKALLDLGDAEQSQGLIQAIYKNAYTTIRDPKNLKEIFKKIDELDWYNIKEEGLGNLYEGLLEKNSSESKSGAGQYFTPRPLIEIMTKLIAPQLGEYCNDPACGTFGFMVAANQYMRSQVDFDELSDKQIVFQKKQAFSGCELVPDTHRLALMNALLHGLEPEKLVEGDTLTAAVGGNMKNYDVVLANPPFGTKKGGERTTRQDITFQTSNKQLNFLQHIYRSLKSNDKARAAVVLPDNVLTDSGEGAKVRKDLMEKCDLHTILRLPTGIFYAQGVKTNVLFFTRKSNESPKNTPSVFFYDMRTNMPSFGKRTPLTAAYFDDFVKAYQAEDRTTVTDERWSNVTREQIEAKEFALDFGLIRDENLVNHEDLLPPEDIAQAALDALEIAADSVRLMLQKLQRDTIPSV